MLVENINIESLDEEKKNLYGSLKSCRIVKITKDKGSDINLDFYIPRDKPGLLVKQSFDSLLDCFFKKNDRILFINNLEINGFTRNEIRGLLVSKKELYFVVKKTTFSSFLG